MLLHLAQLLRCLHQATFRQVNLSEGYSLCNRECEACREHYRGRYDKCEGAALNTEEPCAIYQGEQTHEYRDGDCPVDIRHLGFHGPADVLFVDYSLLVKLIFEDAYL